MSSIINDRVCSPRFNKNPRFLIKNSFWPVVENTTGIFLLKIKPSDSLAPGSSLLETTGARIPDGQNRMSAKDRHQAADPLFYRHDYLLRYSKCSSHQYNPEKLLAEKQIALLWQVIPFSTTDIRIDSVANVSISLFTHLQ